MVEDLWEIALSRLRESDSDSAAVIQRPDGSVRGGVDGLIEDIESKRSAREEKDGWAITLPGTRRDGKPRIVSVRRAVYSILEAAFEFKDIVAKVLAFDPTQYGEVFPALGAVLFSSTDFTQEPLPGLSFPLG